MPLGLFRKTSKITLTILLIFLLSTFIGCSASQYDDGTLPDEPTNSDALDDEELESEELSEEDLSETPSQTSPPTPTPSSGILEVHFIDVGQGDAILIQTPEQNVLIDGGDRGNTVVNYLNSKGVNSLDLVIGTHPHADHLGGLINVFQTIPVKEVIDPAVVHTTKTFEDYLTVIDEKEITFTEGRAGMTRDIGGGAKMEILHPTSPSTNHLNDASIVARVTFGKISFLFTGDAEQSSERQMLSSGKTLSSTILKVGHHGSRTSTTNSFLNAVKPEVGIIMCGANNRYGHPHGETLANLSAAGVKIYRTDVHGTIIITTDGQTYDINVKQPYQYIPAKQDTKPDPEPDPSGIYVGSKKSDKYHYPTCRHAKNILPENERWFNSNKDAKAAGYVPCGSCKPPS